MSLCTLRRNLGKQECRVDFTKNKMMLNIGKYKFGNIEVWKNSVNKKMKLLSLIVTIKISRSYEFGFLEFSGKKFALILKS